MKVHAVEMPYTIPDDGKRGYGLRN